MGEPRSRFESTPERREELVESFVAAARDGDLARLEKLLAADVTWSSDGGGKVTAARRPIEGREKVSRFLAGATRTFLAGVDFTEVEINGASALAVWTGDTLLSVLAFELRDGVIAQAWAVVNPDKLEFVRRQLARA